MTHPWTIRPAGPADVDWIRALANERWGGPTILSRGREHRLPDLPGFVAEAEGARVGLATWRVEADACELVSLDSLRPRSGIGTALLDRVRKTAREAGCRRLWLVTTNDNLDAVRFYQRRGMRLVAVHRGAVDAARSRKPTIPLVGMHGIPIRDEIELEAEP